MSAQAQFLQALLDGAPNLLVVTCGVRETLSNWKRDGVIQDSAWDRLAQVTFELRRVTPHEARQIGERGNHSFYFGQTRSAEVGLGCDLKIGDRPQQSQGVGVTRGLE